MIMTLKNAELDVTMYIERQAPGWMCTLYCQGEYTQSIPLDFGELEGYLDGLKHTGWAKTGSTKVA